MNLENPCVSRVLLVGNSDDLTLLYTSHSLSIHELRNLKRCNSHIKTSLLIDPTVQHIYSTYIHMYIHNHTQRFSTHDIVINMCVPLILCAGVWLLEEESGGCEIPDEFLDVRYE